MPTLSHELRQSGEGAISYTLEECTEVLNSFPLNKVPGNDGLPVEFTKRSGFLLENVYWNVLMYHVKKESWVHYKSRL